MKKYNLSAIMKRAWEIKKEDERNIFSLCLKMAWKEEKEMENEVDAELIGSEKQIKWARDIQKKALEFIDEKIAGFEDLSKKASAKGIDIDTTIDIQACHDCKESLIKCFEKHREAKYYIEHRALFSGGYVSEKISKRTRFLRKKAREN